ncbi:MAG: S41 family peptidase, partial [Trebonia sp.]
QRRERCRVRRAVPGTVPPRVPVANHGIAKVERLPGNVGRRGERRGEDRVRQYWALAAVPGDRYLDRPVYVLTSGTTFSGAEEFAYNLKAQQRATLIGEVTKGGAHPVDSFPVSPALEILIPVARSVNPVTGTNWERTGVEPDAAVAAEHALDRACLAALEHVVATQAGESALDEARKALQTLK